MAKEPNRERTEMTVRTTSTGAIKIEQPQGKNRQRKPKVTVLVGSEEAVREQVSGFVGFLRERAIVGLAVGFVIATQMQAVVKAIITNFIDPAFKLFFGGDALSKRTFTLHFHGRHADFGWGSLAYGLLDFLFVVAAIYAIIKLFNLDKLDKPKG